MWNGMSSSNTSATTCRKQPRWFNRGELSTKAFHGTGMTIARQSFHSMSKRGNGQARRSSHDCLWRNKHENGKSPHHVLTKYILKWPMFSVWTAFLFWDVICTIGKLWISIVICFLERNMCSLSFAICVKFPDNSLRLANDIFVIWREQTCYSRYFTRTWTRTCLRYVYFFFRILVFCSICFRLATLFW